MPIVNQNHTYQDIVLDLGETWTIQGTLNLDNSPLPVDSGTVVEFRMASQKALVFIVSLTHDLVITDSATAAYRIVIPASEQMSIPNLVPGLYLYELSATLSNGTTTIQAEGKAVINNSLINKYK